MKAFKGLLWFVGIVGALVIGLRLLAFKVWRVPADPVLAASVAPTLKAGDVVLVFTRGTPGFGDLVRCPDPEESQRFVVGRIGGLPGDTVGFDGSYVNVNNKIYRSGSSCDAKDKGTVKHPSTQQELELKCDLIDMGSGTHKLGRVDAGEGNPLPAAVDKVTVQANHVYLESDGRDLHDDSRDFGTLPQAACKERIVFRFWSGLGWGDADHRLDMIQ